MQEFSGTKGPWEVFNNDGEDMVIQSGSLERGCGWIGYTCIAAEFQNEKDALLIAAAPELLEACLRIQAQFRQSGIESKAGSLNPIEDNAAQIDAVILKALGQ